MFCSLYNRTKSTVSSPVLFLIERAPRLIAICSSALWKKSIVEVSYPPKLFLRVRYYSDVTPNEAYAQMQLSKISSKVSYLEDLWEMDEEALGILEDREDIHNSDVEMFVEYSQELKTANVIIDAQFCVEQAAKVIFKLADVNPPQQHAIGLDNDRVLGILNDLPEDFTREDDLKRVIFLTEVWEPYYEAAKYGYPEKNITSYSFMKKEDAEKAITDAKFSLEVAEDLLEAVMDSE